MHVQTVNELLALDVPEQVEMDTDSAAQHQSYKLRKELRSSLYLNVKMLEFRRLKGQSQLVRAFNACMLFCFYDMQNIFIVYIFLQVYK